MPMGRAGRSVAPASGLVAGPAPDDVYARLGAAEMVPWTRGLGEDYQDMIDKWDRLGFVVDRGTPEAPFFIEQERDKEALGP